MDAEALNERDAKKLAKQKAKEERKNQRQEQRDERAQQKAEAIARFNKVAGAEVGRGTFQGKSIRFYENGYVEVLGLLDISKSKPAEKLLGIEAYSNIQTKTGVGRGAAAILTAGFSYAVASNLRGTLQLVITTDKKTHALSITASPSKTDLQAISKVEALGKALLARTATQKVAVVSQVTEENTSLGDELNKLVNLKNQGLLTEAEFEAAKKKLLN